MSAWRGDKEAWVMGGLNPKRQAKIGTGISSVRCQTEK